MRWTTAAVVLGLLVAFMVQAASAAGVCLSAQWRIPTDDAPVWEVAGGLISSPLSAGWRIIGEWEVPHWHALSAQASHAGLTLGWSLVWDTVGPALRYAQAEMEAVAGGIVSRLVWAWADPEANGTLEFGAWARVGWPEDYPAGWAVTADLGATPDTLTLLGPRRDYDAEFSPAGGENLLLRDMTLSAWWHRWRAEAVFSIPDGLEEVRLSGRFSAGILVIAAEHLYTRHGRSLNIEPSLWLGLGGVVVHSCLTWEPPLAVTGFRVLGFTVQCPVGNARVELTADLGSHLLVPPPRTGRFSVRVPVSGGTAFSMTTWFGGPGTLWGWAQTDIALQAALSDHVSLNTGIEVGPAGLLAWEAGFELRLGRAG